MIDWKSLVPAVTKWIVLTLLTVIATKCADAAAIVARLNAGDTVPLWNGAINLNLGQIQLWFSTGLIALVGAILGWIKRVKLKRDANIALALPKGANKSDVQKVAANSLVLSAEPDAATVREVSGNLGRAGIR